jgi:hypothetical protein
METKKLKVETVSGLDLLNAVGWEELESKALSIPIIKKKFNEYLEDAGIMEGITEATIEAGFNDFLIDMLENTDVTITFDIDHFYD